MAIKGFFGLLMCFLVGFSAQAVGLRVSGIFENSFVASNQLGKATGSFVIENNGRGWLVKTVRADENLDYIEVGSVDGEEIFLLASHSNASAILAKEPSGTLRASDIDQGFAQITRGIVPHFNTAEQAGIIWLAYASGYYFQSVTNNRIEPVFWFGGQHFFNTNLTLPSHWILDESPLGLPARVVYFNDGYLRGVDGNAAPKLIRLQPPYNDGYTNAVFEVESHTQVGNLRVPEKFSLKIFRPKRGGQSSHDLELSRVFSFRATNATLVIGANEFKPRIIGKITVKDRRFAQSDGVTEYSYSISNNWPTMEDVRNQKTLLPDYTPKVARKSPENKHNLVPMLVIMVTCLGPILIFFLAASTKNKKQTNI